MLTASISTAIKTVRPVTMPSRLLPRYPERRARIRERLASSVLI
jgi:hypothetical protein